MIHHYAFTRRAARPFPQRVVRDTIRDLSRYARVQNPQFVFRLEAHVRSTPIITRYDLGFSYLSFPFFFFHVEPYLT